MNFSPRRAATIVAAIAGASALTAPAAFAIDSFPNNVAETDAAAGPQSCSLTIDGSSTAPVSVPGFLINTGGSARTPAAQGSNVFVSSNFFALRGHLADVAPVLNPLGYQAIQGVSGSISVAYQGGSQSTVTADSNPAVTFGDFEALDLTRIHGGDDPNLNLLQTSIGTPTVVATGKPGTTFGFAITGSVLHVKLFTSVDPASTPVAGTITCSVASPTFTTIPIAAPLPKITSVFGTGYAGYGGLIAVSGSSLSGLKSLTVNGKKATVLSSFGSGIVALAPKLPAGTYRVVVTTASGDNREAALSNYTYR